MRIRILPLLIGFAAVTLVIRLGVLWTDLAPAAQAQTAEMGAAEVGASEAGAANLATAAPSAADAVMASLDETFPSPAAGSDDADEEVAGASEMAAAPSGLPSAPLAEDPFDMSDQEIELLQQLSERRRALDSRAQEIEQRASLLAAAEERVQLKIDELADLQATIEELLIQHDDQEEAQMQSLVKIYENMKPKDAARIFEELDMIVLLEVVDRMKERKVAPVLAKMNPARAKAITLELAQRRELPVAKN